MRSDTERQREGLFSGRRAATSYLRDGREGGRAGERGSLEKGEAGRAQASMTWSSVRRWGEQEGHRARLLPA